MENTGTLIVVLIVLVVAVRWWRSRQAVPVSPTADLISATSNWSAPFVMRHYKTGPAGDKLFQHEAETLQRHGYDLDQQSEAGSHLHAGRLLLTGGLSVFAGKKGIRSGGDITMTFRKT